MDLLATVKKSGSRGGAGDFKWSEVQTSSHRENYLGHSLMAPVGRWQKNRDLNWYAKGESADSGGNESAEDKAARQRAEEIKRVKEAEEDALSRALGLPVPDRSNPNNEALGARKELEKVVQETAGNDNQDGMGIGYDRHARGQIEGSSNQVERIEGNAEQQDKELQYALKEYKRRHGEKRPRRRSRSTSRDRGSKHDRRIRHRDSDRQNHHHDDHRHRRRRSRSNSRQRHSTGASRRRSRSPDNPTRSRHRRSRSPRRRSLDRRQDSRRD